MTMRRIPAVIVLLVLLALLLGATPVMMRLQGPIMIPSLYLPAGVNMATAPVSLSLSTDTARVAFIFKVPSFGITPDTGTLTHVGAKFFFFSAAGGDSAMTCTLKVVAAGVPQHLSNWQNRNFGAVLQGVTAGLNFHWVALDSAPVCTAGQTLCVQWRKGSANLNTMRIFYQFETNSINASLPLAAWKLASPNWTRGGSIVPVFGIKFRGAYVYTGGVPVDSTSTWTAFDSAATPDEMGNRINLDMPMTVTGFWSDISYGAGFKGEFCLYDTTGTNGTLLMSATINDTTQPSGSTETTVKYIFGGKEVTLNAGQTYRYTIRPMAAVTAQFAKWTFTDSTSMIYGVNWRRTYRANLGAWTTDNYTVIPNFGLIVTRLSAGQTGGGPPGRRRRIQLSTNGQMSDEDIGPWADQTKTGTR